MIQFSNYLNSERTPPPICTAAEGGAREATVIENEQQGSQLEGTQYLSTDLVPPLSSPHHNHIKRGYVISTLDTRQPTDAEGRQGHGRGFEFVSPEGNLYTPGPLEHDGFRGAGTSDRAGDTTVTGG